MNWHGVECDSSYKHDIHHKNIISIVVSCYLLWKKEPQLLVNNKMIVFVMNDIRF